MHLTVLDNVAMRQSRASRDMKMLSGKRCFIRYVWPRLRRRELRVLVFVSPNIRRIALPSECGIATLTRRVVVSAWEVCASGKAETLSPTPQSFYTSSTSLRYHQRCRCYRLHFCRRYFGRARLNAIWRQGRGQEGCLWAVLIGGEAQSNRRDLHHLHLETDSFALLPQSHARDRRQIHCSHGRQQWHSATKACSAATAATGAIA